MTTLQAKQLIYTNVEADFAPSGRRGFQIWLVSPELKPIQHEIAKRIDDFVVPDGGGYDKDLIRHVYAGLPNDQVLIARTVPLEETDRFGRGGRFLAHALVIAKRDFVAIGCNPFRILDGTFPFFTSPAEVMEIVPTWRSGDLPLTLVRAADSSPANAAPHWVRAIYKDVWLWLKTPSDRMLAIASKPLDVLDIIRELFAYLPEVMRTECSFDTLSTGEQLDKIRYRIAGGWSEGALRRWIYRKYHRFDQTVPYLQPVMERIAELDLTGKLALKWLERSVTEEQKSQSSEFIKTLQRGDLRLLNVDGLDDLSLEEVVDEPEVNSFIHDACQQRLKLDLTATLTQLPAIQKLGTDYFAVDLRTLIARLSQPIGEAILIEWLYEIFHTTDRPTDNLLESLLQWLKTQSTSSTLQLRMILFRWHAAYRDKLIHSLEKNENSDTIKWFRNWCWQTMPREWRDRTDRRELLRLFSLGRLPDEELPNLKLFLAIYHHEETAELQAARFWHWVWNTPQLNVKDISVELGDKPDLEQAVYEDWLAEERIDDHHVCYFNSETNCYYLGKTLTLPQTGLTSRKTCLLKALADIDATRFFTNYFPEVTPPTAPLTNGLVFLSDNTPPMQKYRQYYLGEAWPHLKQHLAKNGDALFLTVVNDSVMTHIAKSIKPMSIILDDCHLWVGLPIDASGLSEQRQQLLKCVIESIIPTEPFQAGDPANRDFGVTLKHRLTWLMKRLRYPRDTHNLPLSQ